MNFIEPAPGEENISWACASNSYANALGGR